MGNRFALLIGNGRYANQALTNPAADVQLLAQVLGECGFETIVGLDLSHAEMGTHIRTLHDRLKSGGALGVLFFAGHGCELGGDAFLLPVDCPVNAAVSTLVNYAWSLTQIEAALNTANSPFVFLMDMCRSQLETDNLFLPDNYKKHHKHSPPTNSLYVFSTSSGSGASDGKAGAHSPFVKALVKAFEDPHVDIERLLRRAIEETASATNGAQRPRTEGGLLNVVPLSPIARLARGPKLKAHNVKKIYGLCADPLERGVLAWDGGKKIYEVRVQGTFPRLELTSGEIACMKAGDDCVWIAFRDAEEMWLTRASQTQGGKGKRAAFQIALDEAHAIEVDNVHQRVYVAGRKGNSGKCVVFSYANNSCQDLVPPGCKELYIAKEIAGERVILAGPYGYAALFSWCDHAYREFPKVDKTRTRAPNYYSIEFFERQGLALIGASGDEIHRFDVDALVRHDPLTLPAQWADNDLFDWLGEVATSALIEQFISDPGAVDEEARQYLIQNMPRSNVVMLHKTSGEQLLLAHTDMGRLYTITLPELKVIDSDVVNDGSGSGHAVIGRNGAIFVHAGGSEIQSYGLK